MPKGSSVNPKQIKKHIGLRLQGKKPRGGWLQSTQIELAGICTADCEFCNWTKRPDEQKILMPKELAFKAIKEAKELNVDQICFHITGESLLHPDILEIIPKDYPTVVSTNCMLLTGKIAEEFSKMPHLLLIMAVLWSEPESRRELSIANAKAYLDLVPCNRDIYLQMICTSNAVPHADRMYEMFEPYLDKLPNLQLHYKQPYTRGNMPPILGYIPEQIKTRGDNRIQVDRMPTPQSCGYRDCTTIAPNPTTDILVQSDGQIKPCFYIYKEWGLGNIKDTTLTEAWNSDRMQEIRNILQIGDPDNKTGCHDCIRMARLPGVEMWFDIPGGVPPTEIDDEQVMRGMRGHFPTIRKYLRKAIDRIEI